jgi:hypothetical protein
MLTLGSAYKYNMHRETEQTGRVSKDAAAATAASNSITTNGLCFLYIRGEELKHWGLHTIMKWEERIPVHSHVQPGAVSFCFPKQVFSFPQFCTLPAELQYRILTFCSAHTLFQVMHVPSTLCTEASKRF